MPHIPAYEGDGENKSLYHDAELVIYTSELDEIDSYTDEEQAEMLAWQKETGLNSLSLWARWDEREIPIYSRAPAGSWFSLATQIHENVSDKCVSKAFIRVNADPWDVTEDDWEKLSDAEKLLTNALRWHILKGEPTPEQVEVFNWCKERVTDDD